MSVRTRWLGGGALIALLLVTGAYAQSGEAPAAPAQRVRFDNHKLVAVHLNTLKDVDTMLAISGDFWTESIGTGVIPFRVPPEQMAALDASGLKYEILLDDIQPMLDREQAALQQRDIFWFSNYKRTSEIYAYIDQLIGLRPDLVTRFNVGTTIQGNAIDGMRITGPGDASNRPAIFFNGGQHAREWIGPMTVMYIADQLVTQYDFDPEIHEFVDKVVFYIVPVVNVDGYEYTWDTNRLWRKNRRNNGNGTFGVDLNRNWATGWGGAGSDSSTSSDIYRGTAPFSEPETTAVRDFMLAHPDIFYHIDFHSYSQLILWPFGYDFVLPPQPDLGVMQGLGMDMAAEILAESGETYTAQPSYDLYLASGTMNDWAYDGAGAYSWTIELRPDSAVPGFELPPSEIVPTAREIMRAIRVLGRDLVIPLNFSYPDGLPTEVLVGSADTFIVNIAERSATIQPNGAQLFYRVGTSGPFVGAPLADQGNDNYLATLPMLDCGEVVQFFISVNTDQGVVTSPLGAPASFYSANAAVVALSDEMETNTGWTVGAAGDTATTGIWSRSDPQGTAAQPEDDHTPGAGVNCWVTDGRAGTSVGTYDVDGGRTTLTSPAIDLTNVNDAVISYWRWYSNVGGASPNDDVFRVQASSNGTTWVPIETVGPAGDQVAGGWFRHQFRVADFLTGTPASVQVRFIAEDADPGSIIEAAIDDLEVRDIGCSSTACVGDFTGDGTTDLADLGVLLGCWASPCGDLTGDGNTDLSDLGVLLGDYGCTN